MGFYNDDDIPDALVKFAHGPGYPVYYYSQTTVIDGKTGARLIDPPLRDTIGSQSSGLTVAMEGSGNDVFLVWMADCLGHKGATEQFAFTKDATTDQKTHSDICRLRFKSKGTSRLVALSRHLSPDGATVYNSETRIEAEHSKWVNTSSEAYDYVMQHPEILDNYRGNTWVQQSNNQDKLQRPPVEQEAYGDQSYANMHRTSSKKGPSLPAPATRRQKTPPRGNLGADDQSRQHGGSFPSHYLNGQQQNGGLYQPETLDHQSSGRLYPQNGRDDEYGFPYRNDDARNYFSKQYGPYYSNGRSQDEDDLYPDGFPYNYRSYPQRRGRTPARNRKSLPLFSRTRRGARAIYRRHVGPHDNDGIQRLISTGTLAPTLLPAHHTDHNHTIDVIFATYWTYPTHTTAILVEDQKCISEQLGKEMIARFDEDSPFYQMDHEEYEKAVTQNCLQSSDHQLPEDGIYRESDEHYNPFKLNMGQMTVYRLRLKFSCSHDANSTKTDSQCATVLPFAQQRWAAYMGTNGDSHWTPPSH